MTPKKRCFMGRSGDDAVTSILGAILVAALLVGLLVTVRVSYVPVWESEAEASHMLLVQNQLSAIKSQMDRQAGDPAAQIVGTEVLLGQTRSSIFSAGAPPGNLQFVPSGVHTTLAAPRLNVIQSNGTLVPVVDAQWELIFSPEDVEDVEQVVALRLRIHEMDDKKEGETVRILLSDASGASQGRFEVTVGSAPSQYVVLFSTYNANGELLTQAARSFHIQTTFENYFVNVLEPEFVFDQVLAAATKPMTVSLTHSPGMPADYNIAYLKSDGTGQSVLVGGGVLREPYQDAFTGGSLVFTSTNSYFVQQTFILENGALVLSQPDGAVLKVNPNFRTVRAGDTVGIALTLPTLVGDAVDRTGDKLTTVFTQSRGVTAIDATAPEFTVTVASAFPGLWADFWRAQLEAIQLDEDEGHFSITTTATAATLTVHGLNADPDVNDVAIRLVQGNILLSF